jgi:dihydroneopterin aldolase
VVQQEMNVPSKLLETVAFRIIKRLTALHVEIEYLAVSISKLNPPINGDVEQVTIKEIYKKFV